MTTLTQYSNHFFTQKSKMKNSSSQSVFEIVDKKGEDKKIIQIFKNGTNIEESKDFLKTVSLLKSFNHDNVISIKDGIVRNDHVFLQFDYIDYDLEQVLKTKAKGLSNDHIKYVFYQTVLGVCYLHSKGVEHLNLRPKNILLTNECDVKIGGFNSANPIFLPKGESMKSVYQDYYTAPETILNNGENEHCAFKADIWALGCIFFELLERKNILNYQRQYLEMLKWVFRLLGKPDRNELGFIKNHSARSWVNSSGQYAKKKPSSYLGERGKSSKADSLLDAMLQVDPSKRPTACQILSHPFFEELFDRRDLEFADKKLSKEQFLACYPTVSDSRLVKRTLNQLVQQF